MSAKLSEKIKDNDADGLLWHYALTACGNYSMYKYRKYNNLIYNKSRLENERSTFNAIYGEANCRIKGRAS